MPEEGRALLRLLFEAESDIPLISQHPNDWKQYAEWLEELSINDLNEEIIRRNGSLCEIIQRTIETLQDEISIV